MKEKIAVYGGTFDPPTNGHLYIIERAALLFDRLVVAIGINPDKKPLFTTEERLLMLADITKHLPHVEVRFFDSYLYLIDYAKSVGAGVLVRGLRNGADFESEHALATVNRHIANDIVTVFLDAPDDLITVRSSSIKHMVGPQGWEKVVSGFVPETVLAHLIEKRKGTI